MISAGRKRMLKYKEGKSYKDNVTVKKARKRRITI
jgi:hypothetical protein